MSSQLFGFKPEYTLWGISFANLKMLFSSLLDERLKGPDNETEEPYFNDPFKFADNYNIPIIK